MSDSSFSYFETLKPTADDLEHAIRVEITLDTDWCSYKQTLSDNEPYRISALHSTSLPTLHILPLIFSRMIFYTKHSYRVFVENLPLLFPLLQTRQQWLLMLPSVVSNTRPYLSPAILAKRWYISLDAATSTLNVTTQNAVRNIHLQSERKVRIKAPWLQFPSIKGEFYVDSMFSKVTALHGFTGGSIYTNGSGYDRFYPWK
jgi:hypothetical protein